MSIVYLVTGAAGHLGNTVVHRLVETGKHVRALVLPGDRDVTYLPDTVERFVGDVTDKASLSAFFQKREGEELVVIHCAGIVTIASRELPIVRAVNVDGTKNVLAACRETGVKRLVYVSSVHAIPELPHGEIITEPSDFSPDAVRGLYAKTKAEATAAVLAAAKDGLDACVVHPSGIAGPGDYGHGHLTQMLIDYSRGSLTAGVVGGYDFVDVRDVADGILACCDHGRRGECYILSGGYVAIDKLFVLMSKVTGRREVHTFLPMWFARATAPLAETYYKIRRQPPLFTAYSLYTLTSNAAFSHEKATNELSYAPRPLEATVRDTLRFLKAEGRV